jgi:hypothetical protein
VSTTRSPSRIPGLRSFSYEDFRGIDTSRGTDAMDTGERQHLAALVNGFCDWRGHIVRDPGAEPVAAQTRRIIHLNFFGRGLPCWAQDDEGGISLGSIRDHTLADAYAKGSPVCSTVFNQSTIFASRDQPMYQYSGSTWTKPNSYRPAFAVAIQRRLAIAGMPGRKTLVDFSRVDNERIFSEDEDPTATQVTKGANIDLTNVLGTADEVKGLGVFENSRLAIFTNDRTLVYTIHPDFTRWAIDDRANINVGTISHNTICVAGADLLFCSRHGVHSIRRSEVNGITTNTIPLSSKVESLYRDFLRRVGNPETISAYFDQDEGQYHIFFPVSDQITERLTLTIPPVEGVDVKWSTGNFLNATCGAVLGGETMIGTAGGVWRRLLKEQDAPQTPEMVITTPILWHGDLTATKEARAFVLQAQGSGTITMEAFDDIGRRIGSEVIEVEPGGTDDSFPDVPLKRQYERKFEHRYRGVQFRFTVKGSGLLKFIGFAVIVRM